MEVTEADGPPAGKNREVEVGDVGMWVSSRSLGEADGTAMVSQVSTNFTSSV